MELTLTPELEAEIQQQLDSGRFQTPVDVLVTAMGVLRDNMPQESLEVFDAKLQEGIDDIDQGRTYSEEEDRAYLADLRAKL
jgi:Arc/MetJ-type ribon-helix-helix transcriptional regulator